MRIVNARRTASLDFSSLKKIGVVLKRALYFITCNGKMMYRTKLEEDYIVRNLTADVKNRQQFASDGMSYRQLSLFDDTVLGVNPTAADKGKVAFGQL